MLSTIPTPIHLQRLFESAAYREIADGDETTAAGRFIRGLARTSLGRLGQARIDFEAARGELGDACDAELAFLDLRQPGHAEAVSGAMQDLAKRTPSGLLRARALHIAGLAEDRLRRLSQSADLLLEAEREYRQCGSAIGRYRVLDSLGMVQAARGRIDDALQHFALSIAGKAAAGDREGVAISLGNLGRVQLQAGRAEAAIDCFDADLQIVEILGDRRGQIRLLIDLGRARLLQQDLEGAESELRRGVALAIADDDAELQFFARKELVLVLVRAARFDEAGRELAAVEAALASDAEPYFRALVTYVRGTLESARRPEAGVVHLQLAAHQFRELRLPDQELTARIELARALADSRPQDAEQCLRRGLELARSEASLLRFQPGLLEAMASLGIVETALEERDRGLTTDPASDSEFLIREQLGEEGGFGRVYRVYDSRRLREAALKVLKTHELYDPRDSERVINSARRELQAASRVRHPGVAQVLAVGALPDGRQYVLQELVDGQPLSTRMSGEGERDLQSVLPVLCDIARALAALHLAGVVHRDLKPSNVILRPDGRPVLIDFGIAQVATRGWRNQEGVQGTLVYMSPEQALGKTVAGRSDLYSLGVIAYQWLSGTLPLRPHGLTFAEKVRDVATRRPASLKTFCPELPPAVVEIVMSLLEKRPNRRPATALETAERLAELVRH